MKTYPAFRAFRLILLLVLLIIKSANTNAQLKCTLKGTVINRKSTTLILTKKTEDIRNAGQLITIKNGHFEYTFDFAVPEAYELTFKDESDEGAWRPITFFAYHGSIDLTLHPMEEWEKNIVTGGELNKAYTDYLLNTNQKFKPVKDVLDQKVNALRDENAYFSPEMISIRNKVSQEKRKEALQPLYRKRDSLIKTGNHLTEQGKMINGKSDSLNAEMVRDRYAFINSHPDVASYFLVLTDVVYRKDQPDMIGYIQKAYPILASKFPDHPYTAFVSNAMRGYLRIMPGGRFIDFSAPDLQGKEHRIANLVKDQVTLLDFWGSWCGSCIANSKLMMPVYEDFKQKGFQVIGIAREYKNTKALNIALKRDKYPWLNLLELDDRQAIWNKYAISNQGGMIILLDKNGQILAVDPGPEQVRNTLAKLL